MYETKDLNYYINDCKYNRSIWEICKKKLTDVITGEITRADIRSGLCAAIPPIGLAHEFVLHDYKYWSGLRGYCILIGDQNRSPSPDIMLNRIENEKRIQTMNIAIAQFEEEEEFENIQGQEFNEEYYQARVELARHWLKFVTSILEQSK